MTIEGKTLKEKRSEREYRAIDRDSSSTLKDFVDSRLKYYKKYVAAETVEEEEDTKASVIGKLGHHYLLDPEGSFGEKFYESKCSQVPTATMLLFTEALYRRTMEAVDDSGEVTKELSALALDAYNDVKFDHNGVQVAFKRKNVDSFEGVFKRFYDDDAITYYNEIRSVRPNGLVVISASDVEIAERVADMVKNSNITRDIFTPHKDIQVFNELQVDNIEIDDHPLKGMLDRVHADHVRKTIQFYDVKCTWDVEEFYEKYYLYRRSYIQAFVYHTALLKGYADLGFDYSDYEILPPLFIVVDPAAWYEPLIYKLTVSDLNDAYSGFKHKNKFYKGVVSIIKDLKWAYANDVWCIAFENYVNKGIVMLNSKKEG